MTLVHSLDTLWVENFDKIALSRTVKEIQAILCFAIFGENSKWPPFLGRGTCLKIGNSTFLDTPWVKNFDEIALSHTVKEIQAILCFVIFGKNSKIQNGCHFWGGENFLKIDISTFLRYPVVQNGCHFWGGENFLKIANNTHRVKFFEN